MHICFLLHNAYGIGGTIRTTFTLAAALAEHHDVEIVSVFRHRAEPFMGAPTGVRLTPLVDLRAGSPDRDDPRHARPARVFPRADGRHHQYSRLTDARLGRFLRELTADVIVGTRPGLNVHIARQAQPAAVRVGQEHLTLTGRGLRMRHEMRHRYPSLDAVTTVTEADARAYRRLGLPGVRVEAIPNAVPAPSVDPADGTAKVIVAAGRLTPAKRYDLLVAAFSRVVAAHPDWRLRIYGSGDATGDVRHSLTALIGELQLGGHVRLMGKVSHLEPEWVKGSVAASASDRESFGMTLVEAMRCGLPVVSTDCPVGPREIVTDGVDGRLTRPGDADDLAAALLELVEDDALRRRMGEAALRNSARFDPARTAERHADLYRDLVRRAPARRPPGLLRDTAHRLLTRSFDTAHGTRATARRALGRETPASALDDVDRDPAPRRLLVLDLHAGPERTPTPTADYGRSDSGQVHRPGTQKVPGPRHSHTVCTPGSHMPLAHSPHAPTRRVHFPCACQGFETTTERSGKVTADPEHPVVNGELAELRRRLDVAYARVEGGLTLLTHRTEETAKELDELNTRIHTLEHARWPLPAVAALTAVGALVVAIWQAWGR